MELLFFILVAIIIVLAHNNNDLSKEIDKLKRKLSNVNNFCPNCGYALNNEQQNNSNANNAYVDRAIINDYNQVNDNIKSKYSNKELKNSLILVSGSVLIVLSAIVFLTSTWNVTHDFFKTMIIILMLGVFMAASYIANKILKLKQTSNAFYYIALAYIPILLLSIALFSLFGKYLSLYGLGRYIYLTFSSFLVSGIYYYNSIKKDNSVIAIFSMIFMLLGITFLAMIFTDSIIIIMIILWIYNLILMYSYKYNKIFYNNNFHLKVINVLTISLSVITVFGLIDDFSYGMVFEDIALEVLLMVNLYYVLTKINDRKDIYNYIYPIITISIFYSVACLIKDDFIIKQLMILISFVVIYIYEYLKNNEISVSSYVEVLSTVIILYISTFINIDLYELIESTSVLGLKSYIILGLFLLLNIFNYFISNKYKLGQAFTLVITFIVMLISALLQLETSLLAVIISCISIGMIISSLFISKLDVNLKFSLLWVGHISFWLFTLICLWLFGLDDFLVIYKILLVVLYCIYTLICYYEGIIKNRDYLRIISYIYFNIASYIFISLLGLSTRYVIPTTTLIIVIIEYILSKLRSKVSDIYIVSSFIVSFLLLMDYSVINFVILIIMGVIFIGYINYYKKNINFIYIPTLMVISYIYGSNILVLNNFNYMYIVSIMLILVVISLIYYRGKNIYIILFYIYMFSHISSIEECKYVSIILLLIGTYISYIKKDNIVKEVFKFILYLVIFTLYNFIINDLYLTDITILTVGSYLILLLVSTRTILMKYNDSYKVWEYIGSILINFIALSNYTSEMDGIIYVMFLTILVIISYIYKFGPVFIVCLISILLNVFILTRTFWFSIPWYLYILLVGSILVGFAVYNEMKEKKENSNLKTRLENIKDNLNL